MAAATQQIVKYKCQWIVDYVTREKLEKEKFSMSSNVFAIDLGDNKTEWSAVIEVRTFEGKKYLRVAVRKSKVDCDDFSLRFDVSLGNIKKLGQRKWKSTEITGNFGWNKFIALDTLFDPSQKFLNDMDSLFNTSQQFLVEGSRLELVYDVSDSQGVINSNLYLLIFFRSHSSPRSAAILMPRGLSMSPR